MTPAEIERISLLAEEAAEVVEICMKILRHGPNSYNPEDLNQTRNSVLLARELGDVAYAITLMAKHGEINPLEINKGQRIAEQRKPQYLHHQGE